MSLMATQSKSQFLTDVHAQLKRRYKPKPDRSAGRLSVLEAVVYGICHEDATREQANQALSRFKDQFFDWNEVRVSPIAEVQETLADIPDPQGRAERIRRFLRQLFSKTYGFSLEPLTKKPLKEALKVLHAYEAFSSDYVTATVIQQALGGHAIPIDSATRRALERLGISDSDLPSLRLHPRARRSQESRRRVPGTPRGAGPRHLCRTSPRLSTLRAPQDLRLRSGTQVRSKSPRPGEPSGREGRPGQGRRRSEEARQEDCQRGGQGTAEHRTRTHRQETAGQAIPSTPQVATWKERNRQIGVHRNMPGRSIDS